jgi:antitoxin VapB
MALSIKNPQVDKLARAVADLGGESLTDAILHALEERLVRLQGRRVVADVEADLLGISRRCARLPDLDTRSADDILGYDEKGVPRGS